MDNIEFLSWEKITRANPFVVTITEKIDGTNACIVIRNGEIVAVQSRKRFITPEDDNYNFAEWVGSNKEDLITLGDGHHFGEWAGSGIQKNPHKIEGKKFFLFNTYRWNKNNPNRPTCCDVVPVLYEGVLKENTVDGLLKDLIVSGNDFGTNPEGVIVYYHAFRKYTKHTINHKEGKWK